jgi:hypothetical protein
MLSDKARSPIIDKLRFSFLFVEFREAAEFRDYSLLALSDFNKYML